MKKLFLFSILSCALMACTKDDETATLAVTPNTPIVFSAAATEVVVLNVTTNQCEWDAICDQAWCKISQGSTTITVTALPNTQDISPAPATITVRAGNAAPVVIKVSQYGSGGGGGSDPILVVTPPDPIQFSAQATESFTLDVATNQGPWNAISDQPWCRVTQIGTMFFVTAQPSHLNVDRTANITVTSGKATPITIAITQKLSEFVYIPDLLFKALMLGNYDTNSDGEISFSEAANITELFLANQPILDLTGIEAFINLQTFQSYSLPLIRLDLSHNINLQSVYIYGSSINTLNMGPLTKLEYLTITECPTIRNVDLSGCISLYSLYIQEGNISQIDLSKVTKLESLDIKNNALTSLDLSNNTELTRIQLVSNKLTSLTIGNKPKLTYINLGNNLLPTINVSGTPALLTLYLDNSPLTSLDLSNNTVLNTISVENSTLNQLDVSKQTALESLYARSCPNLTTIWLLTGQTITNFYYDNPPTTVQYR